VARGQLSLTHSCDSTRDLRTHMPEKMLSIMNQQLYLLSQLKCRLCQGLASDEIIFEAVIISDVEYALPAFAELLCETSKSRLDAFFMKAKRRRLCWRDCSICEMIDRTDTIQ